MLRLLAFSALMMTIISFWVKRTFWLWGAFLALALLLAYQAEMITSAAFLPIATLAFLYWLLHRKISGKTKAILILVAVAISVGLTFHFFPGFHNWKVASQLILGKDALPYDFWIKFDKPFIGIFLLAWFIPLAQSRAQVVNILKKALPLSVLGVGLLIVLSLCLGVVKWDPKFTPYLFIWPFVNLFFVTIPEEAFFRGFVQEELHQYFNPLTRMASLWAVIVTSLFFMLLHVAWVQDLTFLSLVFVAGCVYGAIYQYTRAIEASILCHFLLNLTHFIFFTYPALKT